MTTYGPDRGKALIVIDGVSTITLDLYRAGSLATRQITYRRNFRSSGQHTFEVRVLGTKNPASTGTRVDLDAFLTILP